MLWSLAGIRHWPGNCHDDGSAWGDNGGAAYIAAKHGVVGLTRQMAVVYSARGITVNCVCPGPILTDLRQHSQTILGPGVPDMSTRGVAVNEKQIQALIPAGTRGRVEDVAAAVCFLSLPDNVFLCPTDLPSWPLRLPEQRLNHGMGRKRD
jgi:NAD(P)-dependent dehydrogenase (short-subunit alcohol dehydrogenase family)